MVLPAKLLSGPTFFDSIYFDEDDEAELTEWDMQPRTMLPIHELVIIDGFLQVSQVATLRPFRPRPNNVILACHARHVFRFLVRSNRNQSTGGV